MSKFKVQMYSLLEDFNKLVKALRHNGSIDPHCFVCEEGFYAGNHGARLSELERRVRSLEEYLKINYAHIQIDKFEYQPVEEEVDVNETS